MGASMSGVLQLCLLALACTRITAEFDEGDSFLPITKRFCSPYYDVTIRRGITGTKGWHDISSTGQISPASELDDQVVGRDEERAVRLPFSFPFYGWRTDKIYVNPNGLLQIQPLDCEVAVFCQWYSPDPTREILYGQYIAALMADLNPSAASRKRPGAVRYRLITDDAPPGPRAIFQWTEVPLYSPDGEPADTYTFQIILYPSGEIWLNYRQLGRDPSTLRIGMVSSGQGYSVHLGLADAQAF